MLFTAHRTSRVTRPKPRPHGRNRKRTGKSQFNDQITFQYHASIMLLQAFITHSASGNSLSRSWDDPPVMKTLENEPKRALSSSTDPSKGLLQCFLFSLSTKVDTYCFVWLPSIFVWICLCFSQVLACRNWSRALKLWYDCWNVPKPIVLQENKTVQKQAATMRADSCKCSGKITLKFCLHCWYLLRYASISSRFQRTGNGQ